MYEGTENMKKGGRGRTCNRSNSSLNVNGPFRLVLLGKKLNDNRIHIGLLLLLLVGI